MDGLFETLYIETINVTRRKIQVWREKMNRKDFSSPLDLKQVQITDEFWGREQELVRR